jgi:hypothetical protein
MQGEAINPLSLETDLPCIRLVKTRNHIEQSSLAGTIGANETGDATGSYVNGNPIHGLDAAKMLAHISYRKNGGTVAAVQRFTSL